MEKKIGRHPSRDEVLSYLMYPDVFVKFARMPWGGVDVLPTPQFFYGMEPASEVNVELEPGKALIIKFLTVGEPHPDGTRTIFFEMNGQPREVTVRDRKLEAKAPLRPKADPDIRDRSVRQSPGWFPPWQLSSTRKFEREIACW